MDKIRHVDFTKAVPNESIWEPFAERASQKLPGRAGTRGAHEELRPDPGAELEACISQVGLGTVAWARGLVFATIDFFFNAAILRVFLAPFFYIKKKKMFVMV